MIITVHYLMKNQKRSNAHSNHAPYQGQAKESAIWILYEACLSNEVFVQIKLVRVRANQMKSPESREGRNTLCNECSHPLHKSSFRQVGYGLPSSKIYILRKAGKRTRTDLKIENWWHNSEIYLKIITLKKKLSHTMACFVVFIFSRLRRMYNLLCIII